MPDYVDALSNRRVSRLWSQYYQGTDNPYKEAIALDTISRPSNIPPHAEHAIREALAIFGGDMGVDANTLGRVLRATGDIESGYRTRVQDDEGPARGYWQVEPSTARSLLKDASALFGKKFRKKFDFAALRKMDNAAMAKALVKDDDLAASMAAAKWIQAASVPLMSVESDVPERRGEYDLA